MVSAIPTSSRPHRDRTARWNALIASMPRSSTGFSTVSSSTTPDCSTTNSKNGRATTTPTALVVNAQLLGQLSNRRFRVRVLMQPDRPSLQLVRILLRCCHAGLPSWPYRTMLRALQGSGGTSFSNEVRRHAKLVRRARGGERGRHCAYSRQCGEDYPHVRAALWDADGSAGPIRGCAFASHHRRRVWSTSVNRPIGKRVHRSDFRI